MSINMTDGDNGAGRYQPLCEADVEQMRDWCPHFVTLLAVYHCDDQVAGDTIIRKADVRDKLNAWLSSQRVYQNVYPSIDKLEADYGYVEIRKPTPQKTDVRLTDKGRAFVESWADDNLHAQLAALANNDE